MRRASVLLAVIVMLGSGVFGPGALAQGPSPVAEQGVGLDLAAMALAPDDIPEGFFDDYGEWWVPPAAFSELVLNGGAEPTSLEQVYQSFYFSNDEGVGIHNYLFEYTSSQAAAAGFGIVDATVLRPPLPNGTVTGPTTAPGPVLGDESSTMTHVTYDTQAEGGPLVDVIASTFRRDRLIAEVAIERYTDPAADGTPIAVSKDFTQADSDFAESLASSLDERITTVMSGGTPAGVDPALSAMVLPLDQLGEGQTPVFGGYKSGIDLLRCGICGEENTLLPFADDALGGFTRILSLGPLVDGEPEPPFVSVAVTAFTSPDVALEVLEAIRQAPNDRPTPGPIPRGERSLVADPVIPGSAATLGFEAISNTDDPEATVDSAGVTFVIDTWLITVDVQGGLSGDIALAVAVDLASQQSVCLTADGPCTAMTQPPALQD